MARFTLDEPIYVIKNNEIHETTARTFQLREQRFQGGEDLYFIGDTEDDEFPFGVFVYREDNSLWLAEVHESPAECQKLIDEWDAEYFFEHAGNHGIGWYRDREDAEEWLNESLLAENK